MTINLSEPSPLTPGEEPPFRATARHSPRRADSIRRRIGLAVSATSVALVLSTGPASAVDTSTVAQPASAPVRHWSNQGRIPVWQVRGWTPTHRMCEMDAITLDKVARWRCLPGPQRYGWVLQTQSSLR